MKTIRRVLLGFAVASVLSACDVISSVLPVGATPTIEPQIVEVTATPRPAEPTATPEPTSEPETLLNRSAIWVGVDGLGTGIATIDFHANAYAIVRIPLNEGQMASNLSASKDGLYLTYLVWNEDYTQRGLASWDLTEPNGRLIARPATNHRIIYVYLLEDASTLIYVQVEGSGISEGVGWRIDSVPVAGGDPTPLFNSDMAEFSYPPEPFAWTEDGSLLVNISAPNGTSEGIYAIEVETGTTREIIASDGGVIISPLLSPDASRIAYLTLDQDRFPENSVIHLPSNILHIYNLRTDSITTMIPPENRAIFDVRWREDSTSILMDIVTYDQESGTITEQNWSDTRVGDDLPWTLADVGPDRDYLFDYESFGEGVAYTVLPVSDPWQIHILNTLTTLETAITFPLDLIAEPGGAPDIIYVPQ